MVEGNKTKNCELTLMLARSFLRHYPLFYVCRSG
jgi:hypothetical protein